MELLLQESKYGGYNEEGLIMTTRNWLSLAHCGCFLLLFLTMGCQVPRASFGLMNRQLYAVLLDRNSNDEEVVEAISRLGPVTESPRFWTQIANDTTYSDKHRRRAVYALFRRHAHFCNSGKALRDVLSQPNWFHDSDISEVTAVAGSIPVEWNSGEKVFSIMVLDGPIIYIRTLAETSRGDLSELLLNPHPNPTLDAVIFQYGYLDDYEQRLNPRHF